MYYMWRSGVYWSQTHLLTNLLTHKHTQLYILVQIRAVTAAVDNTKHSEDTNRPVVVEVAQLVCEALGNVRRHESLVVDNVVTSGVDGALADGLAHYEEIISASNNTRHVFQPTHIPQVSFLIHYCTTILSSLYQIQSTHYAAR